MTTDSLFVPPYLQSLGYADLPELQELSSRAITETADKVLHNPIWSPWRGVLDYVCCVEYSRQMLKALPTGQALGSVNVVPARYYSASLVFFAQASLDNTAVWSAKRLNLSVKGSDCAFHKKTFSAALAALVPTVAAVVARHEPFISKLQSYRQEWIHRLSGGASVYSDKPPSDPTAIIQIMVPINPAINRHDQDGQAYVKAVARTRTNNSGRWLYPITEFADVFADGLKAILVEFLAATLAEPRFSSK